MRLPARPKLEWKQDGTPVDGRVDDVYYSVEDGLAEARAVFLAGCGLPERFAETAGFTVAELGFGTGLNFLALWQVWRAETAQTGWLNFVSFEGFPMDREDVSRALSTWPELAQVSEKLVEKYPACAKGVHQISWPEDRVALTLHIGDIAETLPAAQVFADAWFLDGFSPAKNEAMWDDRLWPLVAARCAPGARLATFTVAGDVRRGLSAAGFEVRKVPGFGRKRHRLEANWPGSQAETGLVATRSGPETGPKRVAIIGAGIAGASAAHVLHQRGADVTVFDRASGPAQGTSGNPLALVMPRLDAVDGEEARLVLSAYLAAQRCYDGLPGGQRVDVTHRPRDEAEAQRFEKMLSDPPLGLDQLEAIAGGVLHKGGLLLRPAELIPAILDGVQVRWASEAVLDLSARTVGGEQFDAVVLATGWHMQEALPWARLSGRAGQVEWLESQVDAPPFALTGGHYALASGYRRLWGATYGPHTGGQAGVSDEARRENAQALQDLAPYWWQETKTGTVQSRTGVRATMTDFLPMIGPMPDVAALLESHAGLRHGQRVDAPIPLIEGAYIAGGFGSRGFTWGPWAGAIVAARIYGDPSPITFAGQAIIAPERQVLRDLKRGKV